MKKIVLISLCVIPLTMLFAQGASDVLPGRFSVSETKQICFSKGNLQHHCKNDVWRFAESQLVALGNQNANQIFDYDGWIDLFGWSTTNNYYGVGRSKTEAYYEGEFVDWGRAMGQRWNILTTTEIKYLLGSRSGGRPDAEQKIRCCVCEWR